MKFYVDVKKVAGAVTYTGLSGTVEYTEGSFVPSYRVLSATGISLGYYLIKQNIDDIFTTADVTTFNFSKSIFDELVIQDFAKFSHTKSYADTGVVSSILDLGLQKNVAPDFASFDDSISYQVDFKRTFAETPQTTDFQVFAVEKTLSDIAVSSERLARHVSTGKADVFSASDTPSLEAGKVFANDFSAIDTALVTPTKVFSDSSEFVDSQRFDVGARLFDVINATDDFLGASNIDDDQTMHFGKTLINNGSASESLSRLVNYSRVFSDTGDTTDVTSLSPNKFLADAAALGDAFSKSLVFNRTLNDSGYLSTQFSASITKPLQDNGAAVETAVKSIGSNNSDSASFTDSGALFWQDYVDNLTYFAQDYVGNRQIF